MKYLLIFVLVFSMLFFAGCFVAPEEPEPEPGPVIVCGGYYFIFYAEWSPTGCEEDPVYPAGTYWVNPDGTTFLLGDPVPCEGFNCIAAILAYGSCPAEFTEVIF